MATAMGAGLLGGNRTMTQDQYNAGRAQWLAGGGMDSAAMPNMTPQQMSAMGPPVGLGGAQPSQMVPNGVQPRRTGANTGQPATFGAQNNLISAQINPTNSAFTQGLQNTTQGAANQYANVGFGGFNQLAPLNQSAARGQLGQAQGQMQGLGYNFGQANATYGQAQGQVQGLQALGANSFGGGAAQASTGRFNADLDGALKGLEGPDRGAIAAETLALLEQRSQPQFEQALRGASQKAAAMGRRGAGMTTNELGDITSVRERDLSLARRDLANDAASRTLSDRLDVSNFQRGVAGDRFGAETFNAELSDRGMSRDQQGRQFGANFQRGLLGDQMALGDRYADQETARVGLGERQAGFTRSLANDGANLTADEWGSAQSERDSARRDEYNQGDFARARFGDFMGATQAAWGQDRSNRNELRDERGYQYGLSRDAVDDEFRTMDFEERLRGNRYGRAQGYLNSGGDGAALAGAYGNAGAMAQGNAADMYGGMAALMAQLGRTGVRSRSSTATGQ